ncbi:UDP-N-acetyl-D-mannosamine dehydrogenase [Altererythrobacter lutimaris]|uniref:UDP-N-acetyl-D-mannosamine dehydrogenase n=1 Tax=Altererythrobacter lutimaris TaxID=2743979 RepID=A0A850HC52_9SPHN|nr:UDP-N-acetyl-D-mannosamine dehydrogenase [Altererythrobacter lutimaris]NVE95733.1 UDP-N-acetyl-D-mannosamine dehydrogenase [Altererythrobacter lutimaris]
MSQTVEYADLQPEEDAAFDVAVIGLGYIGLPTAAVLASSGLSVCGVDVSPQVVETVSSGGIHIEETDLDTLVHEVVSSGKLTASLEVPEARYYVLAVPTPLKADNQPCIDYVLSAAETIAPKLVPGTCVIVESTSPVGTTEEVANCIAKLRPDLRIPDASSNDAKDTDFDVAIAYCPERVLPGKILAELVSNDRVIGGLTSACTKQASDLYRHFVKGARLETGARSAEMVKLVENSFRDVNIAFANELSLIADHLEVDVWEIIRLANRHPRVNILQPGPGVGGHCIAVDPWFLVAGAPEQARLTRTAREVNDSKTRHVLDRIKNMMEADPQTKTALLGLAFKANIDDFRESPALEIAEELARDYGERLHIVEPFAEELPGALTDSGAKLVGLGDALAEAEIVVILVDHNAFKHLPQMNLKGHMVYDTRGMLVV